MAEIALTAGFKKHSPVQPCRADKAGHSPSALRLVRDDLVIPSRRGEIAMRLFFRPPFHWQALTHFLGTRATPGVELVTAHSYQRTIDSGAGAGMIDVRPDHKDSCLNVRISLPRYSGLLAVVQRVRRVFDLEADPFHIDRHLSLDPRLKPFLERRPGLRVPGVWDAFEVAVSAALGHSLSAVDSNKVVGQLVQQFGRRIDSCVDGLTHPFPRPEDLAGADLSRVGIPRQRAAAINALARVLCNQQFTLEPSRTLQDTIAKLSAIDGMTPKAAHYIAMRAFGEPDAFPLEGALIRSLWPGEIPTPEQALIIAEGWRPWRAYAAMHLWADRASL